MQDFLVLQMKSALCSTVMSFMNFGQVTEDVRGLEVLLFTGSLGSHLFWELWLVNAHVKEALQVPIHVLGLGVGEYVRGGDVNGWGGVR